MAYKNGTGAITTAKYEVQQGDKEGGQGGWGLYWGKCFQVEGGNEQIFGQWGDIQDMSDLTKYVRKLPLRNKEII